MANFKKEDMDQDLNELIREFGPEEEAEDIEEELREEVLEEEETREHKETYVSSEESEQFREAPVKEKKKKKKKEKKKKKSHWVGTLFFYLLFFMIIALAVYLIRDFSGQIHEQLVIFEEAQPDHRCQEIFDAVFADPDWAELHDKAGVEDTQYEGRDVFVAYMEQKVGDQALTYERTADVEHARKYLVKLGDETVATFTMSDHSTNENEPDWQMDDVEVFFEREQSCRIQIIPGHTALVNGVALDDSHVVKTTALKVQDGTKEGKIIPQCSVLELDGLLMSPTLTITDAEGREVEAQYDAETNSLTEEIVTESISAEQEELAWSAVKTYCEYMANKANQSDLSRYFKRGTDTFDALAHSVLIWVQKDNGHAFANEKLVNSAVLSDDMFVARVHLTFQLTRPDGSLKESQVDETLFFVKQESGKWLCTQMTAEDVFDPSSDVRLTFRLGDEVLSSEFYDSGVTEIAGPVVTAPEGKVFSGWMMETTAEDGSPLMQRVFAADESGTIAVPVGMELEPMVLYPVFAAAE